MRGEGEQIPLRKAPLPLEVIFATFSHFSVFCAPRRAFSCHFGHSGRFFLFFVSIFRFRSIFLRFGRPRDPPGHQKTMKIIVLSSKIKVSPISKKYPFEVAFGTLLDHFGHHFGRLCAPWGSFWRFLGAQSAPKVEKRAQK